MLALGVSCLRSAAGYRGERNYAPGDIVLNSNLDAKSTSRIQMKSGKYAAECLAARAPTLMVRVDQYEATWHHPDVQFLYQ